MDAVELRWGEPDLVAGEDDGQALGSLRPLDLAQPPQLEPEDFAVEKDQCGKRQIVRGSSGVTLVREVTEERLDLARAQLAQVPPPVEMDEAHPQNARQRGRILVQVLVVDARRLCGVACPHTNHPLDLYLVVASSLVVKCPNAWIIEECTVHGSGRNPRRKHKPALPATLVVPTGQFQTGLPAEAERRGIAVVRVDESELLVFMGEAQQGFRERFEGGEPKHDA